MKPVAEVLAGAPSAMKSAAHEAGDHKIPHLNPSPFGQRPACGTKGAAASGAEFGFFAEAFAWLTVGGTAFLAGALTTTLGTAKAVVDAFVAGAFFAGMEALFGVEVLVAAKALAGVADFVVLLGGLFLATTAGLGFAGAAFFAAAPLLAFEGDALVA